MDRVGEVPGRYLSDEQRLMRETCRRYVDDVVRPFITADREREWSFDAAARLPAEILEEADRAGLRGLGVPDAVRRCRARPGDPGPDVLDHRDRARAWRLGAGRQARSELEDFRAPARPRTTHLQDEWFPRYMADPQFLMAHCLTEPRGASDRWLPYNVPEAGMDTRAVRRERPLDDQRP